MHRILDRLPRQGPDGLAFGGYTICLRELAPAEGGEWLATIPQLGIGTFNGIGATPEQALLCLAELWTELKDQPDVWSDPREPLPEGVHARALALMEMVEFWRHGGSLPGFQRQALAAERREPGSLGRVLLREGRKEHG